jgi:long-subunit acyl-CoA synthetase (AMP-forming)
MTGPKPLLHRFLHWERAAPEALYRTRPYTHRGGDGHVIDHSWRDTDDQARRRAAHLRSLALPPGCSTAFLAQNTAHWIMADLAIWMAGHV